MSLDGGKVKLRTRRQVSPNDVLAAPPEKLDNHASGFPEVKKG